MTDVTQLAPKRCFTHDLLGRDRVLVQEATIMALDLAGFTALTDGLSGWGTRGTEELSRVLRGYFGSVTDLVVEAGGDPVAFGGDSLSIVFDGPPESTLDAALGAAVRIQELTAAMTPTATPAGPLDVQVRVGIARGTVATAVARSSRRLLPVHVGPGLDLAHAAQEATVAGAVAVHDSAAQWPDRAPCGAAAAPATTPIPGALDGPARPVDVGMLLPPVLLDRLRRGRALVESHRVVTVTFVRFPAVEPAALRPFLVQVACLMELVDASGGEVVQVSGGDKGVLAMVVFGAPTAHSDDPVRAVHGMLELRRREPRVAIGIATGPVFAAVLGSQTRMFPTHSGMAVNVAARLSQLAEPGSVLVGDETWKGSSRHLRQAGRPRLCTVRGCATPALVHEVAGWRRSAPRLISSALPMLVGRERELDSVEQLLHGVVTGRGGVLAVEGDPGIGKTRVIQEATGRARTRGFSPVGCDVADHPRGHPVGFWRDLVGGLLDVRRNAPRRAWLDALAAALPDVPNHVAVLGPLLGLGDAARPPPIAADAGHLAPELAQGILGRLVSTESGRRPVLLVVENVDRLDETSLGVLRGVVAATGRCPVGVLVTRGQEENPALEPFLAEVPRLSLAPLDRADTEVLAKEAWRQSGGGTPPSWLAGAVVRRSGGNPLFARVVALALLAQWEPGDPPPAEEVAAGSVASLLLAQVDRLPADAREMLTVLAVAHRPCRVQLLGQVLTPAHAPVVGELTARLVSQRLVTQADDGPEESYGLAHDLLRHVVYDAASHAERERLHRRLVECLGAAGADPVEIAEHVHPLGDRELAKRWFPSAARAARDSWDLTGALRWLQRLQPFLSGTARERVELELLEVLLVAGRANEVLERVDRAGADRWCLVDEPRGSTDRSLAARRMHVLAEATYSCGQLDRTELAASRVMELTDGVDEPRYQRAGELLTLSRCHRGELAGAVRSGRELVDRAALTDDPAARANALAALGVALVLSGQPEAATANYEAALLAAELAGDVVRQVHVLSDLAGCAYMTGRHVACVELLTRARERADTIGYRRHLAFNVNNEAQLRAALGDAYATSCAAVAVEKSLELGDLPTAADALHTWLTARPSLASDPPLWRRLIDVDVHLARSLEAAADWADLAVALARSRRPEAAGDAARDAARVAERAAPGPDPNPVRRRAAFARLLADAYHSRGTPGVREVVLAGLGRLAGAADLDEPEAAEIALERWRLSRSDVDRATAVSLAREAFAAQPSAVVRSWFQVLGEPVPAVPNPLPPPVGIARTRTTRHDLEEALAGVEAAVRAIS